jgi:protein-L-isoaspartate(D-aspartate) O-methyltransferase
MIAAETAAARRRMVEEQIRNRRLTGERLLQAMRAVPRHLFVPPEYAESAYEDRALPIGSGQTISQPYMVALMTAALDPGPGMRILEVGTGSGYQAALLASMGAEVVTIERIAALSIRAQNLLTRLKLAGVRFEIGDGSRGFPPAAPYDGIIVTAGAPSIPSILKAQLADGGHIVIPSGSYNLQNLIVVTRTGESFQEQNRGACAFVPLIGEQGWKP